MKVLDASAVLAFLRHELGGNLVGPELQRGALSTVNLCEVLTRFAQVSGGNANLIHSQLEGLGCEFVPVTALQALTAAKLRPATRTLGLSLGDRICLALAMERQCSVMTADRNWARLDIGVPIELIR